MQTNDMASKDDPDYQDELQPSSSKATDNASGCKIHCTDATGPLTELKRLATWETLKQAAQIRCHDLQNLEVDQNTGLPTISYHRQCYQSFTMKSTLEKMGSSLKFASFETDIDSETRPKRGATQQGTVLLPKECIFCRKNKYKNKVLEKLVKCVDKRASDSISNAATTSDNFYVKGLHDQDLIAREAHYHTSCYKVFTKPQKTAVVDPYKEAEQFAFNAVLQKCYELNIKGEITYFTELLKIMRDSMLSKDAIMGDSTRKYLERNLKKQCKDIKMFTHRNRIVVYPVSLGIQHAIEEIILLKEENEALKKRAFEDSTILTLCGKLIKQEVSGMQDSIPWPPQPEDLYPEKFKIPDSLDKFLSALIGNGDTCSNRQSRLKYSFAQDLIYAVTNGRVKTPKSYLIPEIIKTLTNNTELINIQNKLGHGVSYSLLMESETENAYSICEKQQTTDCIIPKSCMKEAFSIYVADNIDRDEETLTGYGTTHKVNNLLIQELEGRFGESNDTALQPKPKRRRRSFKPPMSEHEVYVPTSNKRIGPSEKDYEENPEQDLLFAEVEENTFLWSLLRNSCGSIQRFPSWTGFNITMNSGTPVLKSTVSYLDCIDAPATEISTIYQVMCRALTIIEALNLDVIVCVFDQAIYSKACEIKWREPEKFKNCVLMMGIFHLLMVYMSILNKRFGDAGLRDALVQSSIIAEGSVESALCGKGYKRGIRLYKVFYEALNRLLLSQLDEVVPFDDFLHTINEMDPFNKDDIIKFKESSEFTHAYNSYLDIRIRLTSSEFKLQQFWMSYLQMVELLLSTIYAVRLGKWDLLLECIRKIIPFAFVYDHVNYARYLPAMLGEMLELENLFPEVHQQFQAGKFAAQLTSDNPFSRSETDKVIEMTLNKDTKTPGGTTGFSTNVNAVRRWEINAGYRAELRRCLHEHLNYKSQSFKHKDLSPSRIESDEKDVSSVITILTETFISPLSESNLLSISTGIEVPEAAAIQIIDAKTKGEELMTTFIEERLEGNPTKDFFDPINKTKIASFSSLRKSIPCKVKGKVVSLKSGKELFSRIAIIAQKRSVDMKSLFSYPLGSLPLALAEMDGTLKKTSKSVLLRKLEKMGQAVEAFPTEYVLIIDGMAAVRQFKVKGLTYKKFAEQLLRYFLALGKNASRIDAVFDVYHQNSIKDVERNRRSHGDLTFNRILPHSEIKQWNMLLSSNSNKNKLVEFIANEWKNLGHLLGEKDLYVTTGIDTFRINTSEIQTVQELECNHQEADTRMLLHARHASMSCDKIIISSPDTDVFMIMLSKTTEMNVQLFMLTGTGNKRRIIDVKSVADGIYDNNETNCTKSQFMKALLGFHCFTGCDTVSSFAGRGKLKPLKLLFKNDEYIDAFASLGEEVDLDEETGKKLERFTLHMYGKKPDFSKSLNDLRYSIYCQKGGKASFDLLPPCRDVLEQHCKRATYQTYIWRQCFNPMIDADEPVGYGWCMNDETLDLRWMTCSPAPDEVLELVSCTCKKSCTVEKCPCFNNDLVCTDACQCSNCQNTDGDEVDDDEIQSNNETSDDSDLE